MSNRQGETSMRTRKLILFTAVLLSVFTVSCAAQGADDPGTDQQAPALDANAEYERLMAIARKNRESGKPPSDTVDISALPTLGSTDAPLAIIEFASFECGYCRRHLHKTMPALKEAYIDSGRVLYVFHDFAPDTRQPHARQAAEAARCAAEQDGYWAYRQRLFDNQKALHPDFLTSHADAAGLDPATFQACLDRGPEHRQGALDAKLGRRLRVRGTPTFFIGRLTGEGSKVALLHRLSGAQSFDRFAEGIEAAEGAAKVSLR
jgi:protein-disulfide isomerase